MRYIQESGITNKASRETEALTAFLSVLSRRAHLLTTDKIGGVLPTADVRSARLCFGTSHRNGKFALAAQHRYFHLAMKNSKYCTLTIVTQERK